MAKKLYISEKKETSIDKEELRIITIDHSMPKDFDYLIFKKEW